MRLSVLIRNILNTVLRYFFISRLIKIIKKKIDDRLQLIHYLYQLEQKFDV